jgi:hypothetical protein
LLKELKEIAALTRVDYEDIDKYPPEVRNTHLKIMKDQLVRSEVITAYVFIDEMLNRAICRYYFGRKNEKDFKKMWRSNKFRHFNHYILEVLNPNEKLRLVKAIAVVPKHLAGNIESINALRNGLAHSLYPHQRRSQKPSYKGRDIFSVEGLRVFIEDMGELALFFGEHNFGKKSNLPAPSNR